MNILFMTETFPYPLDSGGKIVSHQILQMLCKKHRVHVLALSSYMPNSQEIRAVTKLKATVTIVHSIRRAWTYKQSKSDLLQSFMNFRPFYLSAFYENQFTEKVNSLFASQKFDCIHIDHLGMAQYLPNKKTQFWVLCEHNIEHLLHEQWWKAQNISIKEKLFHLYDATALKRYERHILHCVDQIMVLNQEDKTKLVVMGMKPQKILVTPPFYNPLPYKQRVQTKNLLFIGTLLWKPNFDAITWFIQKIFPLLQANDPTISLTIIGDGASLLLSATKNQTAIRALGKINNLDEYLNCATIFIMPFRMGGGVRIKTLTAFAHSIPVVSTTVGMRGIMAKPGIHYLKADDPLSFASQIMNLIDKPSLQTRLAKNALKFLRKYHNRATSQRLFLESYGNQDN